MSNIQEFIINQAERTIKYDLKDFFTILHTNYYNTVDISFMNYFLELVNNEGKFCVEQEKLQEYGVLTNIKLDSNKIKRALDQYDLIESEDYLVTNVGDQVESGMKYKNIYTLTPYAFKLCLIRAKNSKVYANYYLLLEKILKYFQDYQYLYQQKIINMKDDKIDILINDVKEQTIIMKEQRDDIKKQSEENQKLQDTLHEALDGIEYLAISNNQEKVKRANDAEDFRNRFRNITTILTAKCLTSTMNPKDVDSHHYCVLTKTDIENGIKISFKSGQSSYIDKYISKLPNTESILIDKFYNANGIDLRNNTTTAFLEYKLKVVSKHNNKNSLETELYNNNLKKEISKNNKENAIKRIYSNEKKKYKLLKSNKINIIFKKTSIVYKNNNYISVDDIVDLIKKVNNITQQSPVQSDNE